MGVKVEQAIAEQSHQGKVDYLSAAAKDARETRYWLRLLQDSKLTDLDVTAELEQLEEIIHLLANLV